MGLPVVSGLKGGIVHSEPVATGAVAATATKLCAVEWCAALATVGVHCPIHARRRSLRPDYLAADEEIGPEPKRCTHCDASKKCRVCRGTGDHCVYCGECRTSHDHTCRQCRGSGVCQACDGMGEVQDIRKKATA